MAGTIRRAVVIGASIAGVLAARSIADSFDVVVLVDRDKLPDQPTTRGGTPQARHPHGLLAGGRLVMEELFPGTTDHLVARGALLGDISADSQWHLGGSQLASGRAGPQMLAVSRPLLEWYLRRRLLQEPDVELMPRTSVLDLTFSADGSRVTGLVVADCDNGPRRILPAALVVDASGRTSRAPEWLERRGYPTPEEEVRRVDEQYTTRQFARATADPNPIAVTVVVGERDRRGLVMLAQEGGRWTVTLTGGHSERPPDDVAGFLSTAGGLVSSPLAAALTRLAPLDEASTYRFPANRRRRYDRLRRFPDGLVVTGDALCALDPVYGHGMTVAALDAVELRRALSEGMPGLARRFHARAARHLDTAWMIAAAGRPGPNRRFGNRLLDLYLRRLLQAASADPQLAAAFLRVNHLVDRRRDLFHPRILLRVGRQL